MTVASPMKTAKSGWDLADRHPTLEMRVAQFKGSSLTWHHWTTKQLFDETRKLTGAPEEVRPFEKPASKTMHVRDLRLIDPCNSVPCMPEILVRDRAIIVKLQHVRGIVLHDGVLLMEFQARALE